MSEQEAIALIALVGVLFAAVITVVTVVVTGRQKELEAVVDELREQVRDNDARIAKLESRDRKWADYVHVLRRHITQQKPPPPPEWPAGLDQ